MGKIFKDIEWYVVDEYFFGFFRVFCVVGYCCVLFFDVG